ncbi:MAG: hypothetical protein AB8G11_03955 [Saprospiraceae bacterium]
MYYIFYIIITLIFTFIICRYQSEHYPQFIGKISEIRYYRTPNKSNRRDWNEKVDITLEIHQVYSYFKRDITAQYKQEHNFRLNNPKFPMMKKDDLVSFVVDNKDSFFIKKHEILNKAD